MLEERYCAFVSDADYDMVINNVFGDKSIKEIDNPYVIKIFRMFEACLPNLDDHDLVLGYDHINNLRYIRYTNHHNEKARITCNTRERQGERNTNKKTFACFYSESCLP